MNIEVRNSHKELVEKICKDRDESISAIEYFLVVIHFTIERVDLIPELFLTAILIF